MLLMNLVLQYIGITLFIISFVVQCIDYDKHNCAMHWDTMQLN